MDPSLWLLALGLLLVMEGLLYGLFPVTIKRALAALIMLPENQLRFGGLAVAAVGIAILFIGERML